MDYALLSSTIPHTHKPQIQLKLEVHVIQPEKKMFLKRKLTPHDIENMRKDGNMRGLLRALQSSESPAYMAAFQELSRIKPSPIKEVLPLTGHRDKKIRYRAVRLLGEMEDPAAIPEVARILVEQQNDEQMVIFATTALDLLELDRDQPSRGCIVLLP